MKSETINHYNTTSIRLLLLLIILIIFPTKNNLGQNNLKENVNYLIQRSEVLTYKDIDSSKILIDSALALALNNGLEYEVARAKKQKGLIKYFEVKFAEALSLFIESNEIFKSLGDIEGQASALNLIAVVYDDQGKSDNALNIYHQILDLVDKTNITRLASTYNNIGATHSEKGDIEKCYYYYTLAYNTIKNKGEKEAESQYSNNLGSYFIKIENADSALYYIIHGLNLALEINNNHRISNSYENLGDFYYWQNDLSSALKYYNLAYTYANKIEIVYEISSTANRLSKTYAALKDFKKAYHYLLIQKSMEDSIKQKEIASYITQIELEKIFQKERDLNNAIQEKNRLARNIYLIIIIAIFTIVGVLLYGFNQKRKSYLQLKLRSKEVLKQKQEIESQANELAKLSTLKDKLFSIISHDLRSPLVSMVNLLNIAKDDGYDKNEYNELLDSTIENVSYTTTMVDNLLNWASSQQKGMNVKPENLNLNELVESQILEFNNQLNQKNISIINQVTKQIIVFTDSNILQIVFRNLISNAIKFSYKNSEIHISAEEKEENIQVSVKDHGIGMSESVKANIFHTIIDSKQGTNNEKGTGLGLILCKDFIEMNGGTIHVESKEGNGCTFYFTIPKARVKSRII